ncbi:MAG: carbon-nitrogen hydrolase family protein [Gammaproteobacteria bacterium]|nr:carbon-nitrogen hydrolase family protein [Gammaproteobacteria bacterium]
MSMIAAIQMCSSDNVDENLFIVTQLITEAAENGAQLIVLPEMFSIMGKCPSDKIEVKENAGFGKAQNCLSDLAKKLNVWIIGGTIPIACDNKNKVRAACLVYNNKGESVARYDKINLFDVALSETESYRESDTVESGNETIVIDTPFGKLGLCVCYDIRFSNLFIELAKCGAEIIAIPAAFTVKTGEAHWELLMRARAVENFSYVIGACQAGIHSNGRQTYGHTLIVDPWGTVISELKEPSFGIAYAKIDLKKLHSIRKMIPTVK